VTEETSGTIERRFPRAAWPKVGRFQQFQDVLDGFLEAVIVAVDIPIGLSRSGPSAPDAAAKTFLGKNSSRVVATAPRAVLLEPTTCASALARPRAEEGRGFSAHS
jgi:predicted RNase H-like nuclease